MRSWWIRFTSPQKFIESLELFLVVVAFGVVFYMAVVQPLDGDTWWHLRAGEVTFQHGRPLAIDEFSYTKFGEPWTSHAWLTDVWLFVIYKIGNFTGISAWIAFLTLCALVLAYFQMEGPQLYRVFLILIATALLLPYLKARPQMISLVMLILTAWVLQYARKKKQNVMLWLIPIFILWANLHGAFAIGLIFIVLYIIGDYFDMLWNEKNSSGFSVGGRKRLIIIFAVCLIAVMIHPLGVKVWSNLYATFQVNTLNSMIVEWASPNFHDLFQQAYLWIILMVMAVLGLSPRRVQGLDLFIFIFFTAVGFIWRRNLIFTALFGMIILSKYLWPLLIMLFKRTEFEMINKLRKIVQGVIKEMDQITPMTIRLLFLLVSVCIYASAVIKLVITTTPARIEEQEAQQFPVGAIQWIESNRPKGRMMNSYNWGGYFDWNLRDYPVFLDGRTELFGNEIIGQWLNVMNASGDWQEILDRWNIDFIVIEPEWRIVGLLPFYGWDERYRDDQAVIFVRDHGR